MFVTCSVVVIAQRLGELVIISCNIFCINTLTFGEGDFRITDILNILENDAVKVAIRFHYKNCLFLFKEIPEIIH